MLMPLFLAQVYLSHSKVGYGGGNRKGIGKAKKQNTRKDGHYILKQLEVVTKNLIGFSKDRQIDISSKVITITAITVILFSFKIVKILPGISYASGQKLIVVIPLLFLVSKKAGGFSAAVTALNFSILTLIFGSLGQLGVLDLVRTVLLGILIDITRITLPRGGFLLLGWLTVIGGILGFIFGAFSLMFATLLHVPDVIYLFSAPRLFFNTFFGLISGPLSYYLLDRISIVKAGGK